MLSDPIVMECIPRKKKKQKDFVLKVNDVRLVVKATNWVQARNKATDIYVNMQKSNLNGGV